MSLHSLNHNEQIFQNNQQQNEQRNSEDLTNNEQTNQQVNGKRKFYSH